MHNFIVGIPVLKSYVKSIVDIIFKNITLVKVKINLFKIIKYLDTMYVFLKFSLKSLFLIIF